MVVILLLLAANYQSFKLSLVSIINRARCFIRLAGVIIANRLNAEPAIVYGNHHGDRCIRCQRDFNRYERRRLRLKYRDATKAAKTSASVRLRPILMTGFAMIAGMIPMASGLGEAGDQTAPLGRAVIGGLAASMNAALYMVPLIYSFAQENASFEDPSLLPKPTP